MRMIRTLRYLGFRVEPQQGRLEELSVLDAER